jgi:rhodanese-related sulfurtransferase
MTMPTKITWPLPLDVREPYQWQRGQIPGVPPVPLGQLAKRLHELLSQTRIIAVCRSGRCSANVTQALRQRGHDIVNLSGGVIAWHRHRHRHRHGHELESAAGGIA